MLELAGYDTQLFEFIGGEHTAKNLMLVAVKAGSSANARDKSAIRKQIYDLFALYGVRRQRLAESMGELVVPFGTASRENKPNMPRRMGPGCGRA